MEQQQANLSQSSSSNNIRGTTRIDICSTRATESSQSHLFRSVKVEPKLDLSSVSQQDTSKAVTSDDLVAVSPSLAHVPNGWRDPRLTTVGLYYPLGPCQLRLPKDKFYDVLQTLVDVFRRLSVHALYQETPIHASCVSLDQIEFEISIFGSRSNEHEMIIEIERQCGDSVSYHIYANKLICALNGIDFHENVRQWTAPSCWNGKLPDLVDSIGQRCDSEEIAEALWLAWSLISNDRYDARRLGFESLIQITDSRRSSFSVAKTVTKCLMMPQDEAEENVSNGVFEYACRHVLSPTDFSSQGVHGAAEADFCYMSLIVASQVFQIAAESKSIDVEAFLDTLPDDLVQSMLAKMQLVRTNPHQAYYAVQSMVALCNCVPSLRSRVNIRDVEEAKLFGDSCHLALATASQKLSLALQR